MQTSRFQLGFIAALAMSLGFSLSSSDAVGYPAGAVVSKGNNPAWNSAGRVSGSTTRELLSTPPDQEAMVTDLEVEKNDYKRKDTEECEENAVSQIKGIKTYFGSIYFAKAVILTTGTFLRGQIWIGNQSMDAGRAGEQAAQGRC